MMTSGTLMEVLQQPELKQSLQRNVQMPNDYQMQLMLLEQQNKKRLLMARQEADATSLSSWNNTVSFRRQASSSDVGLNAASNAAHTTTAQRVWKYDYESEQLVLVSAVREWPEAQSQGQKTVSQ